MVAKTIIARGGTRLADVLIGAALSVPVFAAAPGHPTVHGGNMPEGLWVLNQARSIELVPGKQTLWIVKDDGKNMVWVSVMTDTQGRARISSFDGAYGGPPVKVMGSEMTSQAISRAPGTFHNFGEIAGLGSYAEDCAVDPAQTHFTCDGQVSTASGVRHWHDDFDWAGPSPR